MKMMELLNYRLVKEKTVKNCLLPFHLHHLEREL
jgi:hypothetical protein